MAELYYGGLELPAAWREVYSRSTGMERLGLRRDVIPGIYWRAAPPMNKSGIEERSAAPRIGNHAPDPVLDTGCINRRLRFGTDH